MKPYKYLFFSTLLILSCLIAQPVIAGVLSGDLMQLLSEKKADDAVKVIIKLTDPVDIGKLKTELDTQTRTLADRHARGIAALKETHRRAQAPLLDKLNTLTLDKKAAEIKSYWLVNAVVAEITAGELTELAARQDIETIDLIPQTFLIAPDQTIMEYFNPAETDSVTSNLTYVNAHLAHAAGFTGLGRLVCTFDTGVDGNHPALKDRWKGLDGDSAAAWFDPYDNQSFPHTITNCGLSVCYPNHGTHVMGILTGRNPAIDYTVGVAPEARWISAAVVDIAGTSFLNAFEWAADPDGNPNTIDDVPDVINHSWGIDKLTMPNSSIGCANVFFDAIDNIEMLGIVNIFGAGNTGRDTAIYNPANRANDSLDCFAIGNINVNVVPPTLSNTSSRGPSDCPGGGIKPNVVAPGYAIRSTLPNNSYGSMTGTSMAAPHVSGLVALLRQKNPNATVDEIKKAILAGTQAEATWGTLPNNHYGWGAIDCLASLNYLSAVNTTPHVRVYDFTHAPISPGNTASGTVVLQNIGADATNVTATLVGYHPSLTVLTGTASFGNIAEGDTVRSDDTIRVIVSDTVTEGSVLSLDFNITGTGYTAEARLYFLVEPPGVRAISTHSTGKINFSLSNYGILGLGAGSLYPVGGEGFRFNSVNNDLWEGGLILGRSTVEVSSGIHSYIYEPNMDFTVAPGGNMQFFAPGEKAPQQSYSVFRDDNGNDPLGVDIRQESFSFEAPYNDFIMIRYVLTNTNSYNLTNVHLGMFLDWDIYDYTRNAGGYEVTADFSWQAYNSGVTTPVLSRFRGMKLIEGPLAGVQTGRSDSIVYIYYGAVTPTNFNGYTKTEKYNSLVSGFTTANTYKSARADLFQVMSAGPMSFLPGAEKSVTFIIMAGDSLADLQAISDKAVDTFINIPWAPLAPFCLAPSDTLLGPEADSTPTFTWTPATDANPDDTVRYLLQYDTDINFNDPVSIDSLLNTTYTPSTSLSFDINYYWRVFAYDQNGDTTISSNVRRFILMGEPGPFLVVEPDTLVYTVNDPVDEMETQTFHIADYYGSVIPFTVTVTSGNPWLSLTTNSGNTPADVTPEINVTGLDYGTYCDSLAVTSDSASNSPVFVFVLLNYQPEVKQYVLKQNIPNPFSRSTSISFVLDEGLKYTLSFYNILGRRVDELSSITVSTETEIIWTPPGSLASGIYFYKLSAPNFESSLKMVLLK
ncbi:MAG: S8 family serine peptidase [candidate division Zixibacteria bacterium]|nr:S8 family serine peptidase [candidate division Zixibacteria bacterium]